nr:hypothetical protein CFP56_02818 [Quercus suber]
MIFGQAEPARIRSRAVENCRRLQISSVEYAERHGSTRPPPRSYCISLRQTRAERVDSETFPGAPVHTMYVSGSRIHGRIYVALPPSLQNNLGKDKLLRRSNESGTEILYSNRRNLRSAKIAILIEYWPAKSANMSQVQRRAAR